MEAGGYGSPRARGRPGKTLRGGQKPAFLLPRKAESGWIRLDNALLWGPNIRRSTRLIRGGFGCDLVEVKLGTPDLGTRWLVTPR